MGHPKSPPVSFFEVMPSRPTVPPPTGMLLCKLAQTWRPAQMAISLWTVTTNQWMYVDVWYTVVFHVQTYKTYQDMPYFCGKAPGIDHKHECCAWGFSKNVAKHIIEPGNHIFLSKLSMERNSFVWFVVGFTLFSNQGGFTQFPSQPPGVLPRWASWLARPPPKLPRRSPLSPGESPQRPGLGADL